MKATELMVGDWVRIIDDDTDAFFDARVEGIDSLANIYATMPCDETAYPYSVDCAKPIPLTTEILEKNGFLYKNGVWMWLESKGKIYISHLANKWSVEVKNELARKDDLGRADLVSFLRDWAENVYVHELQHAIRLAGIEKEIVL